MSRFESEWAHQMKNPEAEYKRGFAWGLIYSSQYVDDHERSQQMLAQADSSMKSAECIDKQGMTKELRIKSAFEILQTLSSEEVTAFIKEWKALKKKEARNEIFHP